MVASRVQSFSPRFVDFILLNGAGPGDDRDIAPSDTDITRRESDDRSYSLFLSFVMLIFLLLKYNLTEVAVGDCTERNQVTPY